MSRGFIDDLIRTKLNRFLEGLEIDICSYIEELLHDLYRVSYSDPDRLDAQVRKHLDRLGYDADEVMKEWEEEES
jgi:hypothetical protein